MTAPDPIHLIPLPEIDESALPRDRTALDPEGLGELRSSIAASGLRQPIELWQLSEPRDPHRYGLISGFRRLAAFREQHALTGQDRYAAIPAFLRTPADYAAALAAMVEENEIRADLSPYERGRIAVKARDEGVFGSIEEAVDALFPSASRMKRTRLRQIAWMAEEMEGQLAYPESLGQAQALRLVAALNAGFGPVIRTALAESPPQDANAEWELLQPLLAEAEQLRRDDPVRRPGRPRRVSTPRPGLTIRRQLTRDGYCLHFTGREATSSLLDAVFDEIDRLFGPA